MWLKKVAVKRKQATSSVFPPCHCTNTLCGARITDLLFNPVLVETIYETTLIFYKIVTNFGDSLEFSPIFVTKKPKIERNYCHQNWWHFLHSKTHQFLQITRIFTKIGDKKNPKSEGIIVTIIGDIFVT